MGADGRHHSNNNNIATTTQNRKTFFISIFEFQISLARIWNFSVISLWLVKSIQSNIKEQWRRDSKERMIEWWWWWCGAETETKFNLYNRAEMKISAKSNSHFPFHHRFSLIWIFKFCWYLFQLRYERSFQHLNLCVLKVYASKSTGANSISERDLIKSEITIEFESSSIHPAHAPPSAIKWIENDNSVRHLLLEHTRLESQKSHSNCLSTSLWHAVDI